mmetsp:Transcript_7939/g.26381  ORF Transcript_7939/g.26381 Transcript_7939/m.26381 type:complete len:220 (-) Transcript_7939:625-1284(-)
MLAQEQSCAVAKDEPPVCDRHAHARAQERLLHMRRHVVRAFHDVCEHVVVPCFGDDGVERRLERGSITSTGDGEACARVLAKKVRSACANLGHNRLDFGAERLRVERVAPARRGGDADGALLRHRARGRARERDEALPLRRSAPVLVQVQPLPSPRQGPAAAHRQRQRGTHESALYVRRHVVRTFICVVEPLVPALWDDGVQGVGQVALDVFIGIFVQR